MDNYIYVRGKYGLHVQEIDKCATCRYAWNGGNYYACYHLPFYSRTVRIGEKPKCDFYKPKEDEQS